MFHTNIGFALANVCFESIREPKSEKQSMVLSLMFFCSIIFQPVNSTTIFQNPNIPTTKPTATTDANVSNNISLTIFGHFMKGFK